MEHILISPGKLKLMLTKSDLDRYELDTATMDSSDTLTRRAFRNLLADVKRMAGFDASQDKVFIQLYPSRDGGAEIYITRLSQKGEGLAAEQTVKVTGVYRFDSMAALLSACARVGSDHIPSASSAWQGEGGCFLITENYCTVREHPRADKCERLDTHMRAFGRVLTSPEASAYVHEHCECIVEHDAVNTLAPLA